MSSVCGRSYTPPSSAPNVGPSVPVSFWNNGTQMPNARSSSFRPPTRAEYITFLLNGSDLSASRTPTPVWRHACKVERRLRRALRSDYAARSLLRAAFDRRSSTSSAACCRANMSPARSEPRLCGRLRAGMRRQGRRCDVRPPAGEPQYSCAREADAAGQPVSAATMRLWDWRRWRWSRARPARNRRRLGPAGPLHGRRRSADLVVQEQPHAGARDRLRRSGTAGPKRRYCWAAANMDTNPNPGFRVFGRLRGRFAMGYRG